LKPRLGKLKSGVAIERSRGEKKKEKPNEKANLETRNDPHLGTKAEETGTFHPKRGSYQREGRIVKADRAR